jgi:uncharacterized membrane protein YphA (DoxX/SURF4 family)
MLYEGTWLDAAGRLLIVAYFVMHLVHDLMPAATRHHIGRLRSFHVPLPAIAFWIGMAMEATGCVLVLSGWHAEAGIYCLIVFTVVANTIYNRYWTIQDPLRRDFSRMLFGANTAVLGGLLLLLGIVR